MAVRLPTSRRPPGTRRRPRRSHVALGLVVALVLAGCGSSGRELAEVPPGRTAPPRATTTTAAPVSTAPQELTLLSPEWEGGASIPVEITCDGEGRSPAFTWVGVPSGIAELALVVEDPDADGFVHWIVHGIAPTDGAVSAAELPIDAVEAVNDGGASAWTPPCPPEGETHLYTFELLALPAPATPPTGDPEADVEALKTQAAYRAALTGTYGR